MSSYNYDGSLDKRALDAYITGNYGEDQERGDDPADEMEAWQQTASELSAERDDLAARLEQTTRERDALLAACESAHAIAARLMDARDADSHAAWTAIIDIRERLGAALAHEPHGDAGGTPAFNRLVEICQEVLMFIRADDSLLLTDKLWRARYAERIRAVLDALESERHDDWKANEGYERLRAERDALLAACERGMEALLEAWSLDELSQRDARIYAALRTGIALVRAGRDE